MAICVGGCIEDVLSFWVYGEVAFYAPFYALMFRFCENDAVFCVKVGVLLAQMAALMYFCSSLYCVIRPYCMERPWVFPLAQLIAMGLCRDEGVILITI